MASRVFFPRTPTKTDEQAISYFTVNFIDDLVG